MLGISSSLMIPIFTCLMNLKNERIGPRWVLPCVDFTSPRKEKSMVFSYLESLKRLVKEDSTMEFFIKLVPRIQKSIKRYLGELF
jgi:hypothetical protein